MRALRVVARVRLVDREPEQLEAEIGRSTLTSIRLRRSPRYSQNASQGTSCTISSDDALAVRQIDEGASVSARLLDRRPSPSLDLLGRDEHRLAPALVTLGQRPVAGEQLLELRVRGREHRLVGATGRTP